MRIARITLRNWLVFRGTHSLSFGSEVHGVVARLEADAGRSNWLGKSSFLAAARFALFGSFKHLGLEREGEWISRGESEGGVRLELDDGTVVDRRRSGKGSTELAARVNGVTSKGDRAAELLGKHVGLGEEDFCAVAYFEQKRLSRLISAVRPAERQEVVSEWLALGPLRLAEERERKALAALRAREERLVAASEALARVGVTRPSAEQLAAASEEFKVAAAEVERLERAEREALAREAEHEARREQAKTREFLVGAIERAEQGDPAGRLVATTDALVALRSRSQEIAGELKAATAERANRKTVASGGFDGRCPVASVACPIVGRINTMRAENEAALRAAETRERTARVAWSAAAKELYLAETEEKNALADAARLDEMRKRLASMSADLPEHGGAEDADGATERLREARRVLFAADARSRELARELAAAERHAGEAKKIEEELARVRREAVTSREAVAILGRHGAQRRLAREALAAIEARANERLSRAEIDLRLAFEWGRETAEPARECEACGLPFPASARVKECACGAERGRRVEDGLWVRLSDRSGAAEDLAGFELGVAAGEWLREERGAAWGTLFADEPFGALDERHRRALAGSLGRLLSREHGGYEQAFVVAHHPGLMDGLPGRVRIVSDGKSSRFE